MLFCSQFFSISICLTDEWHPYKDLWLKGKVIPTLSIYPFVKFLLKINLHMCSKYGRLEFCLNEKMLKCFHRFKLKNMQLR